VIESVAAITMSEIPFWFHDRPKWVSGIGRTTTCQDILHSLVRSHCEKKAKVTGSTASEADIRHTSLQLALVEQWRGVERPLSGSSKILKLWNAWGEEREQVRFVVKRVTTSSDNAAAAAAATTSTLPSAASIKGRKTRRRNSRLHHGMSGRYSSAADTIHPAALRSSLSDSNGLASFSKSSSGGGLKSTEIERLMRIILTQGETIHSQLKRLQDREHEIDGIEQEVHDSRTKTAGKDYLLNAYLNDSSSSSAAGKKKGKLVRSDSVPECLSEMVEALNRVHGLNEQIEVAEERANDLHHKIRASSASSAASSASSEEMVAAKGELDKLKSSNDRVGREMDDNRRMISSMQSAFNERRAIISKLERDVNVVESEGIKLEMELQRVVSQRQKEFELLSGGGGGVGVDPDDDEDLEEELLNEILAGANSNKHYTLSNSQLYEDSGGGSGPTGSVTAREKQLYTTLQKLHIKTVAASGDPLEQLLCGKLVSASIEHDAARSNATGSPGSSSGNSSGGSTGSSEKSVRFSERDLIMATPDLPPLLPESEADFATSSSDQQKNSTGSATRTLYTKSILKAVDPSGDLDSNSDTGLSSLHSSSDEGTYVLDTLV
jgi:hypothetical protein